jgi:hypothetical protein
MTVSAIPITQDIKAVAGTDLKILGTVELPTDAGDTTITGWTIEFRLAKEGIATLTVSADLVDEDAGTYSVDIASTDTDTLEGAYQYAIMRTDTGEVTALTEGKFIFQATVPAVTTP